MLQNQRITFILPDDTTLTDILDQILEDNNLSESTEEYYKKSISGKESRVIILKDTAVTLVGKKIPESKLIEFLAKHLEIPMENAQKIIQQINEKLIPYAKIIDLDKEEKDQKLSQPENIENSEQTKREAFAKAKEELFKKIGVGKPVEEEGPGDRVQGLETLPYEKTPEIKNVEKNAKAIQHSQQKPAAPPKPEEPKQPNPAEKDPYKESIE